MKDNKLIHGALSYKIMGIVFNVHNELGGGLPEKYYQRALEKAFDNGDVPYKSQAHVPINYKEESIGCFRPDFIIDNKVVLEIKQGFRYTKDDLKQVKQYLEKTGFELGLLVVFTRKEVIRTRVLNQY